MIEESFLTTKEVLDYLQVNLRTVYRLIKAGKIPAVRVGRQWRFRKADIDAWLDGQRVGGPREALSANRASSPGRDRPRVLMVDDEASVREMLAKAFVLADYVVETVADGPTAIDRLRAQAYDLLITDLRIPGVDGLAVIREARRVRGDLPVVIITGYSSEATAIEAIDLGVSGYLTKPVRVPEVLTVAAKALGQ